MDDRQYNYLKQELDKLSFMHDTLAGQIHNIGQKVDRLEVVLIDGDADLGSSSISRQTQESGKKIASLEVKFQGLVWAVLGLIFFGGGTLAWALVSLLGLS